MTTKIAEHAVEYAQASSETLKVASEIVGRFETQQKAAGELVPSAVARLVQAGLISSGEEKSAAAQLSSHDEALRILNNVVDHYVKQAGDNRAKAASANLGSPVDLPGGNTQKTANWAGRRRGSDDPPSEADLALFGGLGLAAPQGS